LGKQPNIFVVLVWKTNKQNKKEKQ